MLRALKSHGRAALDWSYRRTGVLTMARPSLAIGLMYHSVANPDAARFVDPAWHMCPGRFAAQVKSLAESRHVVSLDMMVETLRQGRAPTSGTVVITFDDGYLDNLTVAAPILARYGLAAILYVPTAYVDAAEPQWIDRVHTALSTRRGNRLALEIGMFDLTTLDGEQRAYAALNELLIRSTMIQRQETLREVERQLVPRGQPPRMTLTWDEVRTLVREFPGFSIGGHGAEHIDLANAPPALAAADIRRCAETLTRELGPGPRHFSFPYGRSSAGTRQLVREAGFASAMCDADPVWRAGTDPFALGRIDPRVDLETLSLRTLPGYLALPARLRSLA